MPPCRSRLCGSRVAEATATPRRRERGVTLFGGPRSLCHVGLACLSFLSLAFRHCRIAVASRVWKRRGQLGESSTGYQGTLEGGHGPACLARVWARSVPPPSLRGSPSRGLRDSVVRAFKSPGFHESLPLAAMLPQCCGDLPERRCARCYQQRADSPFAPPPPSPFPRALRHLISFSQRVVVQGGQGFGLPSLLGISSVELPQAHGDTAERTCASRASVVGGAVAEAGSGARQGSASERQDHQRHAPRGAPHAIASALASAASAAMGTPRQAEGHVARAETLLELQAPRASAPCGGNLATSCIARSATCASLPLPQPLSQCRRASLGAYHRSF